MDSQQVADALRTRAHLAAADGKLGTAQDCFTAATLIEQLTKERDDALKGFKSEVGRFRAVCKFLHAYEMGDAMTFVDPYNGDLVSATHEAKALARACLEGPAIG